MFSFKFSQILLFLFLFINISLYRGENTSETEVDIMEDNIVIQKSDMENENETQDSETDKNKTEEFKMEGKVVGGSYANIKDYPHSVFLMAYCNSDDPDENWTCGSSILNQRILLTAAHCVEGCRKKFKIDTFAGSTNYEQANVLRQVRRYILHRSYDSRTVFADIALMFLNKNLALGNDVKRIIIQPSFATDADYQLAGWGVINEARTPTTKLKVVKQKVWARALCNKYEHMMEGTICASSGSKKHYPFAGDSGSALVTVSKQQVGLVSFREDSKPELIIYTNVSYYYSWIKEKSQTLYCHPK